MKRPKDLDAPISYRKLIREDSDHPIHVYIWPPFEEEVDVWACPYQSRGLGHEAIRYARGADGMQALQLSFSAIRADLDPKRNRIRWIASEVPDAGFPRMVPWTSGNKLYERLCKVIDRELLAEQRSIGRSKKEQRQRLRTAPKPKRINQRSK